MKVGRDLVSLLKLGGFHLKKFVSNLPDVTTALDPENRESNSSVRNICSSPDQSSHVLGLKWDHVKDTLVVSRGVDCPLDKAITQRTVLSFVSSVFDPIGLVAPYTVKARLLLKDFLRISGHKWDDDLPEEIKKQFLEWHSALHLLGSLTIPRSYFTEPFDQIELHMFGDSWQDVFCAVAFLHAVSFAFLLPPLISGITYLAVITQLTPVHERFLRKPSRKAAGLMTLVH